MPLTEKQKKHWDKISAQLINRLRQSTYENKSGTKFSRSRNPSLSEHIQLAVDVNSKDQKIFMVAFQIFIKQLDSQIQSNKKTNLAIMGFFDIPEINTALKKLCEKVKVLTLDSMATDEKPALDQYLELPFSLESINQNISEWVAQQYSPIDVRVSLNDHRYQRRMDSLARLLSLPPSLSVCMAVTLDLSMEPRIVIGTNITKNGKQHEIVNIISRKLDTIKRFMSNVCRKDSHSIEPSELDYLAEILLKDLSDISDGALPPDELLKAAKKIIDAICFDNNTFSDIEKKSFLNHSPSTIVLPKVNGEGSYQMQVHHLTTTGKWLESDFALPMIPRCTNIKNIHAEQLIARYLFEELKIASQLKHPLIFGLSKLCCLTCVEYLSSYPVTLRGHHGQAYQGVVNLHNGVSPTASNARHASTQPWSSPKDTPDKRMKRKAISQRPDSDEGLHLKPVVGRLLFSDDPSESKEAFSPNRSTRVGGFFDVDRRKVRRYQTEKFTALFDDTVEEKTKFEELSLS